MATSSKHSISPVTSGWVSAKSTVDKIPKMRACPRFAQWFTIPQAILKPVQIVLGLTSVVLMLLWKSEDVTISSLNKGAVNYRDELHGFVGICLLSILYSIGMVALGISGLYIPPFMQVLFAGVMLILWVLIAPTMSASVTQLDNSLYARSRDLDTLYLQIATGLGFVLLMAFVLDILLGFMLLRRETDNPKKLTKELNQSKSSLITVHSSKSIASVTAVPKKRSIKLGKAGSSSKTPQHIDETSPLKQNEEVPDDEDDDLSFASLPTENTTSHTYIS